MQISNALVPGLASHLRLSMPRWRLLLITNLFMPCSVFAQFVVDPNAAPSQRPVLHTTANGLPQVDISAPTAGGVSINRYQQFDVGTPGAIINNGRTASLTDLAGWVAANPALLARPATLIVNEVRSSKPSELHGYLEIARSKADLIIANPAGITCKGCGFLHANRVFLVKIQL